MVEAYDYSTAGCVKNMYLRLPNPPRVGTYALTVTQGYASGEYDACGANASGAPGGLLTSSTYSGSLTVTSYDATSQTISGTFSFNAYDNVGRTTVSVTQGVFTNVYQF